MLNRYFYSLLILWNLWAFDLLAGATGPDGNPPAPPQPPPISINRLLDAETRQVLFTMVNAIVRDDLETVRPALEGEHVLDCFHLPGVTFSGHDVNAIELAVSAGRHEMLRFLLTFARDNQILASMDPELARAIAARRGDFEALRIINAFWDRPLIVGPVIGSFCAIQ